MSRKTTGIVSAVAALLALGACSHTSNTQLFSERLAATLKPGTICNNQATVEYLSNGARIRIPEASLFDNGRADLTRCGQYTLASVTQAMLDLSLMQIAIEPGPEAPTTPLSQQRADAVAAWLSQAALLAPLHPTVISDQAMAQSPGALAVLVQVSDGR
jgi:outer membrane protein OmpA-like peptidoglycan-associated protein